MNPLKEVAKNLVDDGLNPIPLKKDKSPMLPVGHDFLYKQIDDIENRFKQAKKIGIACGTVSDGFYGLDFDCHQGEPIFEIFNNFIEMDYIKRLIEQGKLSIYSTAGGGYHTYFKYRQKVLTGTTLARWETKSVMIEVRGNGQYIACSPSDGYNHIAGVEYIKLEELEDEIELNQIYDLSRSFNQHEEIINKSKLTNNKWAESWKETTPDGKYNLECEDEALELLEELGWQYINTRNDGTQYWTRPNKDINEGFSATFNHFKGMFYIFSEDGNCKPFQSKTGYSPFNILTLIKYDGDWKRAKDDLTERFKMQNEFKEEAQQIEIEKIEALDFPLDVFPDKLAAYISKCNETLSSSVDYMGCALLFLTSLIVGNSMKIEVKPGWYEYGSLWLVLVGKAGIGKTPSINNIVRPIQQMNSKEIKQYAKDYEKYEFYENLDKKEKKNSEDIQKPIRKQFIVNDITLEALADLHEQNKNGVGVIKDELAGWIKDLNKYRQGSDLEHWLSSWSGKEINLNRKTAKSSFVEKSFIPVMGGIQPEILNSFYTKDNKSNGFIDRMLFSFPDLEVTNYNKESLDPQMIEFYNSFISDFYTDMKKNTQYTDDCEIDSKIIKLSPEAQEKWIEIFNRISNTQNDDNVNEYMKSMLPKQKSYIPRFALLIHVLHEYYNGGSNYDIIGIESIDRAEQLSNYFIAMAMKIKVDTRETNSIKQKSDSMKGKTKFEIFKSMYTDNPKLNVKKVAEILDVSRTTIYRFIKELKM